MPKVTELIVTRLGLELRWSLCLLGTALYTIPGGLVGGGSCSGNSERLGHWKGDLQWQVERPRTGSGLPSAKKIFLLPSSLCLLSQGPWGQGWGGVGRKPKRPVWGPGGGKRQAGSALTEENRARRFQDSSKV